MLLPEDEKIEEEVERKETSSSKLNEDLFSNELQLEDKVAEAVDGVEPNDL